MTGKTVENASSADVTPTRVGKGRNPAIGMQVTRWCHASSETGMYGLEDEGPAEKAGIRRFVNIGWEDKVGGGIGVQKTG